MTKKANLREIIPIEQIVDLYVKEKCPVAKIAEHFGVSQQNIYDRLSKQNVKVLYRRTKHKTLSKELLIELHSQQFLTIGEISKKLKVGPMLVSREMRRHGIPVRPANLKRPLLSSLEVGEHLIIKNSNGKPSDNLYQEAQRFGIRVIARQIDKNRFMVRRTPALNIETVTEMWASGMTLGKIAAVFGSSHRTIKRYVPDELLKKPTPNDQEIIRLYEVEGLSIKKIGALVGVSHQCVRDHLVRSGVQMRSPGVPPAQIDGDTLRQLFVTECQAVHKISEILGVSPPIIKKEIQRLSLKRTGRTGRAAKYNGLDDLKIGESVLIARPKAIKSYDLIYSAARTRKMRVSIRSMGNDKFKVLRKG